MEREHARRTGFDVVSIEKEPNARFLLWSAHALIEQRLGKKCLANLLFPAPATLAHSVSNFARFGAFQAGSTALSALTGDGENLRVVMHKKMDVRWPMLRQPSPFTRHRQEDPGRDAPGGGLPELCSGVASKIEDLLHVRVVEVGEHLRPRH